MARKQESKIVLTADDKTSRAFKSAAGGVDQLQKKFTGLSLATAGVATVGVAAAAALFVMSKRAIENARELKTQADIAGVNVEAFQELKFAAAQYKVTQEALTDGMKELALRADEFAVAGKGSAAEAFERLGFNASEVNGLLGDTPSLLEEVSRRMEGLGEAAQIRIADEIFGGQGGEQFKALLAGGAAGISRLRNEARDLGLVMDQELISAAEESGRKLEILSDVIDTKLNAALINIAPLIDSTATGLLELSKKIHLFMGDFADLQDLDLAQAADQITMATKRLDRLQVKLANLKGLNDFADILVPDGQITDLEDKIARTVKTITDLKRQVDEIMSRPPSTGTTGANDNGADQISKTVQREKDRAQAWLVQIQETYLQVGATEAELITMQTDAALLKLDEMHERKLISEMEFLEAQGALIMTALVRQQEIEDAAAAEREMKTQEHYDRMEEIIGGSMARSAGIVQLNGQLIKDMWQHSLEGKFAATALIMGNISQLMESNSKKAFAIGKAAAIGETIISTLLSAQRSYEAFSWFPPLAAAMAAISLAAGFARLQAIKSTTFKGGGSVSGAGGGGGGGSGSLPQPGPADVPALAPPANDATIPTTVFINIESDAGMVSTEWVRDNLIPALNEAAGDGMTIKVG